MPATRVFSDEYLAMAGRPTCDLIADALAAGAYEKTGSLVEQLHNEICTMLFGYLTWPKVIRRCLEAWYDRDAWMDTDAGARQCLSSEPPLPKPLLAKWEEGRQSLLEAAQRRDREFLLKRSRELGDHALSVHDAYMDYAAVLVSEVARRFGEDAMQQALTEVMVPDAMGIDPQMPFRRRVEALIRFTRLHLQAFKLVEDDEKMTFIATPCPSGGRQVLAGLYRQDGPGELIRGKSPKTYDRTDLPAYCCHESALEAASIRRFGSPVFVVDPAAQLGHRPCHVYVYKDPNGIPERFYRRVGLRRSEELIAQG